MTREQWSPQTTCQIMNVADQLCGATQAAARAAGPWIGRADKIGADQAAVDALYSRLGSAEDFSCKVVIGEGDKDAAPMLAHGDILGRNLDNHYDLAVDPIDGTTFVAENRPGAIAIAALASPGSFLPWSDIHYMKKLVVGPAASVLIDNGDVRIDGDPVDNMQRVAYQLGKSTTELVVAILDRPRNQVIIDSARVVGAKVMFLSGGDIVPAILTSLSDKFPTVDMLYSSGGAPEAVLTAAGVAALGGNMQAMWHPRNHSELERADDLGQLGTVLGLQELVGNAELHFAMTSITGYEGFMTGCRQQDADTWEAGETVYLYRQAKRPALAVVK